jgi:hypothetical protein
MSADTSPLPVIRPGLDELVADAASCYRDAGALLRKYRMTCGAPAMEILLLEARMAELDQAIRGASMLPVLRDAVPPPHRPRHARRGGWPSWLRPA